MDPHSDWRTEWATLPLVWQGGATVTMTQRRTSRAQDEQGLKRSGWKCMEKHLGGKSGWTDREREKRRNRTKKRCNHTIKMSNTLSSPFPCARTHTSRQREITENTPKPSQFSLNAHTHTHTPIHTTTQTFTHIDKNTDT